jgi:hypothetical protein
MADESATKRKRGRPKGSVAKKRRDVPFQFMLLAEEKAEFQAAADRAGLALSQWMRTRLHEAARREGAE